MVLGGFAAFRACEKRLGEQGDSRTLWEYVGLVAMLTTLAHLQVDTAAIVGK